MLERCEKCDGALANPLPLICTACGEPVGTTAVTDSPPLANARADGIPMDAEGPHDFEPDAMGPTCPGSLLVILSSLLCAGHGAMAAMSRTGKLDVRSEEVYVGAGIGLAVGLFLAVDDWRFHKQLSESRAAMRDDCTPVPLTARPSEAIPIAMLVFTIAASIVVWCGTSLHLSQTVASYISHGAILITSVLGYFSIRQMLLFVRYSKERIIAIGTPAFTYLGMLVLWIICFPLHFVARSHMGGRDLVIPGLIATGFYCLPIIQPFFMQAELPSALDPQVLNMLKEMVEQDMGLGRGSVIAVEQVSEISYDASQQLRVARCLVVTRHIRRSITYEISWRERRAGNWQVSILQPQ